jgi:hypothetical protein
MVPAWMCIASNAAFMRLARRAIRPDVLRLVQNGEIFCKAVSTAFAGSNDLLAAPSQSDVR